MTELSKSKPETQSARPALYEVNKRDFYIALFGAPMLTALLFFWVLLIPVFAVLFGGVPWLIFGGPALWSSLRKHGPGLRLLRSAFVANLVGTPLVVAIYVLFDARPDRFLKELIESMFVVAFGCIFSLIWATAFWWIFHLLTKRR
ncbi:hypothetical protein [Parasedimentitalea huanghaiensis]|uniref:Uncharacterized protein n=1 Tax=Parasedimentitalea huanghaiensis TaxID=2682100 RepID=A0A6L6WD21_9RHOB|nr:hypothetical protein [Zongyanglinia huanghaiensis]MVO15151.1 hypothetical protein [Zongyanglinia huanghaiensis]